jgi:hypothetical protein
MEVFGELRFELAEAARSIDAVVGGSTPQMVEAWSEFEYGSLCDSIYRSRSLLPI